MTVLLQAELHHVPLSGLWSSLYHPSGEAVEEVLDPLLGARRGYNDRRPYAPCKCLELLQRYLGKMELRTNEGHEDEKEWKGSGWKGA